MVDWRLEFVNTGNKRQKKNPRTVKEIFSSVQRELKSRRKGQEKGIRKCVTVEFEAGWPGRGGIWQINSWLMSLEEGAHRNIIPAPGIWFWIQTKALTLNFHIQPKESLIHNIKFAIYCTVVTSHDSRSRRLEKKNTLCSVRERERNMEEVRLMELVKLFVFVN
jgi:hypothetical protein